MYRFPRLQLPQDLVGREYARSPDWPLGLELGPEEFRSRIDFAMELAQIASQVTLGFFRTKAYQVEMASRTAFSASLSAAVTGERSLFLSTW